MIYRRIRLAAAWLVTLLLTLGLCGRSFALYGVRDVSKDLAKDLGISVQSKPSANNDTWVQVGFKATGKLKAFTWADLELTQNGKRLVTAQLQPKRPNGDKDAVLLEFYIDPAAVSNASITIFVHEGLGGTGYELQMKNFLTASH